MAAALGLSHNSNGCSLRGYVLNALLMHLNILTTYGGDLFKSLKKTGINLKKWHEIAHD